VLVRSVEHIQSDGDWHCSLTGGVVIQALQVQHALIAGEERDLYTTTRFESSLETGAPVVDLAGFAVWPGLINAHDHLELNHYFRSQQDISYTNVSQWYQDLDSRLKPHAFRRAQGVFLADRLFVGGLKNLLCGALTVVHHNPLYGSLEKPDFPVHVLRRYGWAHSLSYEKRVIETYRKVEQDVPWIIHLAEGVDDAAALEFGRLKKLGCVQPNTVLVHGVGLTEDDMLNGARGIRGLVWCPSSNRHLLGYTANVELWRQLGGRVALGTDSRLTADGDLLDEMAAALETGQVTPADLLALVTTEAAAMFDMADTGGLSPGMRADWIATRADIPLVGARRADLALIVRGGVPQIGDPDVMARFPGIDTVPATLDGRPKAVHAALARQISNCRLQEPGLIVSGERRRWWQIWGSGAP
jgi:cytosine/adenosine deaminase-related metal-dependent hydrolase